MSNSLWLHRLQYTRFLVHHQLAELAQIHVHRGSDEIQPSHPLLLPSFPAFKLSQHQGLFQWVSSSHQSNHIWFDLNQIPYDYTAEVRNRFKGVELIDRVLDELWNEVRDIVQETGIKTISMEKKCKKAKWLSEEALQIAVKRREAKSKGEKER